MKVGTKSLLFGGHQFIIHPLFVYMAWVKLYKKLPNLGETICIIIHDWGYWGSPNMDGARGEFHPNIPSGWLIRLNKGMPNYYSNLILCHSRFMARKYAMPVSKLCLPDKYGVALTPIWLIVFLTKLSGEIKEYTTYQSVARLEISQAFGAKIPTPEEFFKAHRIQVAEWIRTGDLTIKTIGKGGFDAWQASVANRNSKNHGCRECYNEQRRNKGKTRK
jgi:hypothetical protein